MSNSKNSITESYNKISEWFDEHRSRELFEKKWLDKALSYIKPGGEILDLGCGMGEPLAQYFLEQGYKVTGIDGSSKLIEKAKKRLPKGNFLLGDMRETDLDKKFDMMIAWNSFFHLSAADQRAMFSVFKKHLKLQGVLLFTSGSKEGEVWSDNDGEDLYHSSLSSSEYKQILKRYGFELLEYKLQDKDCNGHSIWLMQLTS